MDNLPFDRLAHVRKARRAVAWSLVICLPIVAMGARLWAAGQVAAPSAPHVQRPSPAQEGILLLQQPPKAVPERPSPESSQPPSGVPIAATGSANGATYVGAEVCAQCHYDKFTGYQNSAHAIGGDPRTPAGQFGCESCHGPA